MLKLTYNELVEIQYCLKLLENMGNSTELSLTALSKVSRMINSIDIDRDKSKN